MKTRRWVQLSRAAALVTAAWAAGAVAVQAKSFNAGFDANDETAWTVRVGSQQMRLVAHGRTTEDIVHGAACEVVSLESEADGGSYQLEHDLPAARVFDELQVAVWFQAPTPGAAAWVKIVFPHEIDPRTGKPLTTFLKGDVYETVGKWQLLRCGTADKDLQDRVRQLRAALSRPNLNLTDAFVNRVLITGMLPAGVSEVRLDELRFGPVVPPANEAAVRQVAHAEQTNQPTGPVAEFDLGRLAVEGRPFFPIVAARHSESVEMLRELGLNVVWVPDYEDTAELQALREQKLWAMATPPRAVAVSGKVVDAKDVNVLPFGEETQPILLWNLGTAVPADAKDDLLRWLEQIHNADRDFRRPLMADVSGGDERVLSRHVPMLGVSRHVANTTMGYKSLREWFIQKRQNARPGTFVWTWVQTEPFARYGDIRPSGEQSVVLEPEQIRLQVYTALAAGCRGIGYWKTTPFDADVPGNAERRLTLAQLNLELELLRPWLATGTVVEHVPFFVKMPASNIRRGTIDFRTGSSNALYERNAMLREREYEQKRQQQLTTELEATLIRSDHGMLLLPIWYGTDAQFVPSQMAAHDATIVVPGVNQSASAWEVTTTSIRSLPRERIAGGLKITLSKFDQTTAVIISSDRELIAMLRKKVETLAQTSAQVSVALAKEKLERVRQVDAELQTLGVGQPDAPQILDKSQQLVNSADDAYARGDFHGARQFAADAMQLQRILQRAHWNDAVRSLTSPVSSPHAVCFQTLPDHWRLIQRIGSRQFDDDENLLRSGNFEDFDTMVAERWPHTQQPVPGVQAGAMLDPSAQEGDYSLRLVAVPRAGATPPHAMPHSPVTVRTPAVPVRSGQVLHISGWVRVPQAIQGSLDGALLYDNLAGPVAALRWSAATPWQRFFFIREVERSGDYQLTMELSGLGEVQFDELRIVAQEPPVELASPPPAPESSNPFGNPLKLLERLPRWNTNPFRR